MNDNFSQRLSNYTQNRAWFPGNANLSIGVFDGVVAVAVMARAILPALFLLAL
jgi:hypothetical protein